MNEKNTNPTKTALIISTGMLAVYLSFNQQWAVYVSLAVGFFGLFGFTARVVHYIWMKLAGVLGMIVPNILLTLIFYLFLTPIALLSRLFGDSDPLQLKKRKSSLFKNTDRSFDKSSFEKPW